MNINELVVTWSTSVPVNTCEIVEKYTRSKPSGAILRENPINPNADMQICVE